MKKPITIVALLSLLISGVLAATPALAQEPGSLPRGPWGQHEDPELARIVLDIALLNGINDAGLEREQIRKLIPVLEGILRDEERLRSEVKERLLRERQLLIEGKQTAERVKATKREIQEMARRFGEKAKQSIERTRSFLTPKQVQLVAGLVTARPGGFFRQADAGREMRRPGPGAERPEMREREGRWREMRRPPGAPGLGGPSTVILRRVIELLKEKLQAM